MKTNFDKLYLKTHMRMTYQRRPVKRAVDMSYTALYYLILFFGLLF